MKIGRFLGLDILSEKYSYVNDPVVGYTSSEKSPDHWVSTTCGYCSVGCGMYIGVKAGRAVSVRGDSDHPVNIGKLCPKGLSEHYTLVAENRACYPLLKENGQLRRVSWDHALGTLVERFRAVQQTYGPETLGIIAMVLPGIALFFTGFLYYKIHQRLAGWQLRRLARSQTNGFGRLGRRSVLEGVPGPSRLGAFRDLWGVLWNRVDHQ